MRKWIYTLIVFNIIVIGAIIWCRHTFSRESNPQAVELKRLLKEGVVQSKLYHLHHQKATAETCLRVVRIIRELPLKRPELFRFGTIVGDQHVIGIVAFRDDIPLIDKAMKEWDSPPVKTTKGSI